MTLQGIVITWLNFHGNIEKKKFVKLSSASLCHLAWRRDCLFHPTNYLMKKHFHASRWRHQMEIFSAFLDNLCGEFTHQSSVNFPHKGQWCGALMFSLICAWINGWANNGEAGDLRRHRAHHDIIVMLCFIINLFHALCFRQFNSNPDGNYRCHALWRFDQSRQYHPASNSITLEYNTPWTHLRCDHCMVLWSIQYIFVLLKWYKMVWTHFLMKQ